MAKYGKPRTSKGLATLCARLAEDKIARDVIVMDLSKVESAPSDFFVICTCDSDVQVRTIAEELRRTVKNLGLDKPRIEGLENSKWVLIDFFDVVVHLMLSNMRNFYRLEKLWGDAKFYELGSQGKLKTFKEDFRNIYSEV